jgi:hypothetical protein
VQWSNELCDFSVGRNTRSMSSQGEDDDDHGKQMDAMLFRDE